MALLLNEIMEKLKQFDEVTILECLNIDSEMLVERFADLIEEKYPIFNEEFEEDEMSEM